MRERLSNRRPAITFEAARDAGIVLSLALQHGCDLWEIARALSRDPRGAPSGILGVLVDRLLAAGVGL
jgi:hypothetical protein